MDYLTLTLIHEKSRNLSVEAIDREDLSLNIQTRNLCAVGQGGSLGQKTGIKG